jgi:hypothetical protein
MTPWLETIGVVALAAAGVLVGGVIARLRPPFRFLGFAAGCAFFFLLAVVRWVPLLPYTDPASWILGGRRDHAIFAFLCPAAFVSLAPHTPRPRDRRAVNVVVVITVAFYGILPFLLPALMQQRFAGMQTTVDRDGVCIQTTGYTCGPAAAVTALGVLGLPADEGELAVRSRTTPLMGTLPECLRDALLDRYGGDALTCDVRAFDSIDALGRAGLTIAVVRLNFFIDHYVVVLDVTPETIVLGDPLRGKREVPREEFARDWRRLGLVMSRTER